MVVNPEQSAPARKEHCRSSPSRSAGASAPLLRHYVVALGLVAASIVGTLLLWDPLFSRNPFALLFAAVIVSAWYGGMGPGLLATALCAWGYGYFVVPSFLTLHHGLNWVMTAGVFALIAVLISTLESLRSRALRNMQQAKESAEAANRAKDEFLAVLSHELRTPLTPALFATAALADNLAIPAEAREDLAMIRRNIELEARLIDDLLDLTRITRGKLQLRREPVDIHALISHVLAICAPEAQAKQLDVQLDLSCARPHVNADPARINQVLWNLVKNAVKFTPQNGRIVIRTRRENGAGAEPGQIVVDVVDTGLGIEPHVLPRIFDAFEQGERANSHRFGGLGLGLAISKALTRAHGGELFASSEGQGHGSTFTLRLNLSSAAPAAAEGETSAFASTQLLAPVASVRPLRVLLVEDHEDTSRVVGRLLQSLGYDVRIARTMTDGLRASREEAFDLLISDLGLPDGSGLELMRTMRDAMGESAPPAVALSGYGMEHDLRQSRDAGFAAHLTKPIQFGELEAKIRELTGTAAVTASA